MKVMMGAGAGNIIKQGNGKNKREKR